MRTLRPTTLAAILALAATAAAQPPPDAETALRAFFAEPDATRRESLARRFADVAPPPWDKLTRLLRRAASYPDLPPGLHRFTTPGDDDVPPVAYVLRVPPAYRAGDGRAWPLLVGCHGTGSSGEGFLARLLSILGPDADSFLLACPDAPEKGPYRAGRVSVLYPLRVLADVRRRAAIDADRASLTGYSKGGYATWGTALFYPGDWAAAVPMAGWPLTEARSAGCTLYLENLLGLAVQAHWGADDIVPRQTEGINTFNRQAAAELRRLGASRFEAIEYPGQRHALDVRSDKVRALLLSARREPFPNRFRMTFHRIHQGRAPWARAVLAAGKPFDFDQRRVLRIRRPDQLDEARRRLYRQEAMELGGQFAPDSNTLTLQARNLAEIEVDLSAERLDFARPVRIVVNGRTVESANREVDWAVLLETARETYDFQRLVAGRLRIPVRPGRR